VLGHAAFIFNGRRLPLFALRHLRVFVRRRLFIVMGWRVFDAMACGGAILFVLAV
jgi:hypothetical protein